ncbi:MAG: hypothetical protein KDA42_07210 [Planctomycetales bacterium]|nr:hypothetical protein [Planctomycetales bacterium]
MPKYQSYCDDYYININLSTEMELSTQRETILNFFERIQKKYPEMRNFYNRDRNDFVLEEDKHRGCYRWCTTEPRRICSGQLNPETCEGALEQHRLILDLAPYMLSVSPLDCEALDVLYGFDFNYRGNHNALLAEALGVPMGLERIADMPGGRIVNYEPSLTMSLDEECRVQCRVSVETRTNAYHIRTGEYPEDQISVFVSARRYGSLPPETTFTASLDELDQICRDLIDNYVIDALLEPLARTIAMK